MKNILTRNLSIVGGIVGALVVLSAVGAVANSSHRDAQFRSASASAPMLERSARFEDSTPTAVPAEQQNAQVPEAQPEVKPEEPNEAAEDEAVENDNDEQPAPVPPTSAPATSTRTFSLIGGTVVVTCTGNMISLDSASPNPGFTIDTEQNDGGQVEVRFRSDSHESRLEVTCQNGSVIVQELREEES
jgi:hypothetical protein